MKIENMKVLSIDDNQNNLLMIEAFSKKLNLNVDSYLKPVEALKTTETIDYDLIIVDYMMPEMDGVSFIKAYRNKDKETPIIMITAAGDDAHLQLKALEEGATDFLSKPVNGAIFQARVKNLLTLKKSLNLVNNKASLLKSEVDQATNLVREREAETLRALGKLSEYKDPETNKHVIRVSSYSKIIAKAYGLNEKMQDIIYNAAPFHDIGKVGIPDKILLKPDRLNEEEWQIMKTHSYIGYEILKGAKSKYLHAGSIVAYTHHERFDGKGYPKGLKGEIIPLYGRIVALSDVFDALSSKRPYKRAWPFEEAYDYIISEAGKHFDPQCVAGFERSIEDIKVIYHTYQEVEE